ncbi:MAG: flavin reductase [Firmicutes bacterium]|nr:flavin reductase [Bacillota bacterium]
MKGFDKLDVRDLEGSAFRMIGDEWMIVTASNEAGEYNSMTASWGGLGVLWGEPVAFVFVRPQRYTHEFSEAGELATLSFFGGEHKKELSYFGIKSGRYTDKFKDMGFHPIKTDEGSIAVEEAATVLSCRKLYADEIKHECFIDSEVDARAYPAHDYHTVYVYRIEGAYKKEQAKS